MSAHRTRRSRAPGAPRAPRDRGLARRTRERWWTASSAGELGSLPIFFGLILIAIVFQSQNVELPDGGQLREPDHPGRRPITTIAMGLVFVLLLGEIDLSVGFVSGVAGVMAALLLLPDGNAVGPSRRSSLALAAGVGDRHAARPADHEDRHPVVRGDARRPAGLAGRRAAAHRRRRHRDPPERRDHRLRERLPAGGARLDRARRLHRLYAAIQICAVADARARRGCRPSPVVLVLCASAPSPWSARSSSTSANQDRGIPYVFARDRRRCSSALDVRAQPHALRPPRLRGRRQRRGRTARGHQRRPHQDRRASRSARRWRRSAASSSPPACARSTPTPAAADPAVLDRGAPSSAARRCSAAAGTSSRARARRARHRVDRQRPGPARPELRHEVRHHRPACCCWPWPSTRIVPRRPRVTGRA